MNIKYAERLELAAKIIKENLEFQVYYDEGKRWIIHSSSNIGVFAQEDWEDYQIRLSDEPLEFEDIWPGSVIRLKDSPKHRWMITYWSEKGIEAEVSITFVELKEGYDINRSLARGKWDPEAWEPCSK